MSVRTVQETTGLEEMLERIVRQGTDPEGMSVRTDLQGTGLEGMWVRIDLEGTDREEMLERIVLQATAREGMLEQIVLRATGPEEMSGRIVLAEITGAIGRRRLAHARLVAGTHRWQAIAAEPVGVVAGGEVEADDIFAIVNGVVDQLVLWKSRPVRRAAYAIREGCCGHAEGSVPQPTSDCFKYLLVS